MKLYRFMSNVECVKLAQGKVLENHTDHRVKRGTASTAKGFCFGIGDKEQARKDFRHLIGILDFDFLVVVDVKPERESKFTSCQGRYVDCENIVSKDDRWTFGELCKMFNEYCTEAYSLSDFEECHFYKVLFNVMGDPRDSVRLQLEEIDSEHILNTSNSLNNFKETMSAAREIMQVFERRPNMITFNVFSALAFAANMVLDSVTRSKHCTKKECFDDYIDILKTYILDD